MAWQTVAVRTGTSLMVGFEKKALKCHQSEAFCLLAEGVEILFRQKGWWTTISTIMLNLWCLCTYFMLIKTIS